MFKVGEIQLNDHVLDWKKEDVVKAFSGKDKKGNLINDAESIWKGIQDEKATRKKVED